MAIEKAIMVLTLGVLINVFSTWDGVEAKRGCANFGHSCYGGVGKRADLANSNEELMQNNLQDTENQDYAFTGLRSQSNSANIPRPFRYNRLSPEQYEQMNKYIRELIINYMGKEEEIDRK